MASREFPPLKTLTPVVCYEGDRLIIEVGYRQLSAFVSYTAGISIGAGSATDLGEVEGETAAYCGWIEFSADISFATSVFEEDIEIASAARLNIVPVFGLSVADSEPVELASEALLTLYPEEFPEVFDDEPIEIESRARLSLYATGPSEEDTISVASAALLRLDSHASFASLEPISFASAALLSLPSVVRFTTTEAVAIASNPLARLYSDVTITIETPETEATAIASNPVLWLVGSDTLESAVITEPEEISIASQPVIILGGDPAPHLVVGDITPVEIDSAALLYLYGATTLDGLEPVGYHFRSLATLALQGCDAVSFVDLAVESIASDPVLVLYGGGAFAIGGTADTGQHETWVFTTDAWHPSIYSNYAFNSFFEMNGQVYGVKSDGIYLLEGKTDDGTVFQPGVRLVTSLGLHGTKRVRVIKAENCGDEAKLRITAEDKYADVQVDAQKFWGAHKVEGRDLTMDFIDFDELGHLMVLPWVTVRYGS